MVALVEELAKEGPGRATREQARKVTAIRPVKLGRPKPFVFQYRPESKTFNLRLQFRKGDVERSEVIAALESILVELRNESRRSH